jgi:two-component system sensor histidine kinase KdpD
VFRLGRREEVSILRRILRLAVSTSVVVGIVAACTTLPHIHLATLVLLLLLSILIFAGVWGFLEAAASTVLSGLLLAYFSLPPHGWRIGSDEHWLVLITFLTVAFLTSHLAARAKRQAAEAVARRREVERLYAFGQDLPLEGSAASLLNASLEALVRSFELEAAAYYDCGTGTVTRSGPNGSAIPESLLHEVAWRPELPAKRAPGLFCACIHSAGKVIGSLSVRGGSMSELALRQIANHIEVEIERIRAHDAQQRAEDARRSEELKSAVLESLVHEIKTPLSVIKTGVSSLLSRDSDAGIRRELLTVINEEADHLDSSVSHSFWTARIEAGILQSGKSPNDMRQLAHDALAELRPLLENRLVRVDAPDRLPPVSCDFRMIKGVLKELLNNAVKYSPARSPLTIAVQPAGSEIVTSVIDSGAGVRPGEEERIFEKHYRSSTKTPGTGLGLAFAKTIVEAHGGTIGVKSQPGSGSAFHFSLPVYHQDAA